MQTIGIARGGHFFWSYPFYFTCSAEKVRSIPSGPIDGESRLENHSVPFDCCGNPSKTVRFFLSGFRMIQPKPLKEQNHRVSQCWWPNRPSELRLTWNSDLPLPFLDLATFPGENLKFCRPHFLDSEPCRLRAAGLGVSSLPSQWRLAPDWPRFFRHRVRRREHTTHANLPWTDDGKKNKIVGVRRLSIPRKNFL